MAILITQDRQVANLTPPEGKSRITVSVKSKVGSGLSVESRSGHHFHFQIHLPNSTKLKYNHIVTSNLNILNSTELY